MSEANKKCCGHCAVRRGSPERQDGFGWVRMLESWEEGNAFYCHESIPGHSMQVDDGRPHYRLCAGFLALRNAPIKAQLRHLEERPMADAIMACGVGYAERQMENFNRKERGEPELNEPELPDHVARQYSEAKP